MSSDDDFGESNFRMKTIEEPVREQQLRVNKPTFILPPRIDSSTSLASKVISRPPSPISISMPKRSMSLSEFEMSTLIQPKNIATEEIDKNIVIEKLQNILKDTPEFLKESLEFILDNKSISLIDNINKIHFSIITAILQTHKTKRTLIIVPSNNIFQWIRTFIMDSTAKWPEGHTEQSRAISALRNGRTQVLVSVARNATAVPLNLFDYIFVVKSELCEEAFPALTGARQPIIFHYTPGYTTNFPVPTQEIRGNYGLMCTPVLIKAASYTSEVKKLMREREEGSVVFVCPFKTIVDDVVKAGEGEIIKYEGRESTEALAIAATTSIFYGHEIFDNYVFVGFPPSLGALVAACTAGEHVTVILHVPTALRLQSLSHQSGVDAPIINEVVKSLFWDKKYRPAGSIGCFNSAGADVTPEGMQSLLEALCRREVIEHIPFHASTAVIRIMSMVDEMHKSDIMTAIIKGSTNVRGQYTVHLSQLCSQIGVSPVAIEQELQRFSHLSAADYKLSGEATFAMIKKQLDDNSYIELTKSLASDLMLKERANHQQYNITYTLLEHPDLIGEYLKEHKIPEIYEIPHEPVDLQKVKDLLLSGRGFMFTPRAVARILHGIPSPGVTAQEWGRSTFWRKLSMTSFQEVMHVAQQANCRPENIHMM